MVATNNKEQKLKKKSKKKTTHKQSTHIQTHTHAHANIFQTTRNMKHDDCAAINYHNNNRSKSNRNDLPNRLNITVL